MRFTKPVFSLWFSLPALLAVSCLNDGGGGASSGDPKIIHGTFLVALIKEFPPFWDKHTAVSGRIFDGPTPHLMEWQVQAVSGPCRVIKPGAPFCDSGCGSSSACSEGGVCVAYPKSLNAGKVTVQGVKTASGETSFTMNPVLDAYQASGVQIADPPYAEGDVVTVSAAGNAGVPAFSLSARGPSLPVLFNDSIVLDGNPILLQWTPPGAAAGPSTMLVGIDVSHHGGLKGLIECVAEDDGELEIDGALVDQLRALGVSGFPYIEMVRRTSATLEGHGLRLVLDSRILNHAFIPGLTSCRVDAECPGGQTCQADFKCQ